MLDSIFLRAARCQSVERTPVWFMRQAGRYMPEYRKLRETHSLLEMCSNAELATEVTLMPIKRYPNLDAAILFSDLLVVLPPMGIPIRYVQHEGPHIERPVRSSADVDALRLVDPDAQLAAPLKAIRLLRNELSERHPLIGFAGAPFTLASYLIEGGPSKNFRKTKEFMTSEPKTWDSLLTKLTQVSRDFLLAQIRAGVQAVQVFDSWVGALDPQDYREFVLPHSRRLFEALSETEVPTLHFATGTSELLEDMREAGGDVIGVDWRTPLGRAAARIKDRSIMGNLDPAALFAPRDHLLRRVDSVLEEAASCAGHIFNLGHGILPETPIDSVSAVLEHVHKRTAQ